MVFLRFGRLLPKISFSYCIRKDAKRCTVNGILQILSMYFKCCGSGMFIPDPGCLSRIPVSYFYPSRTGSRIQKQQQYLLSYLFCCHKFHKILKLFYFWNAEEKNLGQFSKNYSTFYPTIMSLSSLKYGFGIRDPRSGIRDPGSEIRDPRFGIQKKPIPDPDPQHCVFPFLGIAKM